MLGLGKWKFTMDTMFYRGESFLTVGEKDGAYDVAVEIPGVTMPNISYEQIAADGNTVTGISHTDLLKGKDIPFSVTFEGDAASGFFKVPFMGKIKLSNGVRIG